MTHKLAAAALACYALLITWLSLAPAASPTDKLGDKPLHATAYAIFVLLAVPLCRRAHHLYWMATVIFIYSGLLEVAQHFVPGRNMSLADAVANGLGILIAVALARWQDSKFFN